MSVDEGCNTVTLRRGVDVHVVSRDTPDALSIAGMFGTAKLWENMSVHVDGEFSLRRRSSTWERAYKSLRRLEPSP